MLTWLFLKDLVPTIPNWVIIVAIPVVVVLKMTANWTMGYWWERKQLFEREQTWANERNKLAKNINEQLLSRGGV